jgi:hypothetical protein
MQNPESTASHIDDSRTRKYERREVRKSSLQSTQIRRHPKKCKNTKRNNKPYRDSPSRAQQAKITIDTTICVNVEIDLL